jgi:hypothetical protein
VERGEAFVAGRADPGSRALLIVNREVLDGGRGRVCFVGGVAAAALDLLAALGYPPVRLPDPLPAPLAGIDAPLAAAGLSPWKHAAVIVERPMDTAHPLPVIDPLRLVLEDTPHAIAEPRSLA